MRSFRILIIQDARTSRRPANRTAQLTVWDVVNITLDEGSQAGAFGVGQRFMVNLSSQITRCDYFSTLIARLRIFHLNHTVLGWIVRRDQRYIYTQDATQVGHG